LVLEKSRGDGLQSNLCFYDYELTDSFACESFFVLWKVDVDKIRKLGDKIQKLGVKTKKLGDKTQKLGVKTKKLGDKT